MENDVLKVVKSSAAKVEPLPLVGEGSDNYAGDEMVTKVVPVLEGIQTAAAVSANRYVEQQLLLAADRVREGSSLRAALAELRLFPPMMLYMIASGEQSGELETMLEQAAVNQEREFDTQVGLALGLFEPALVVMMAGVVLFIVIAILEPMLQLNNMVGM
ncbi:type II secretion system F family protein [Escherichia coli]|uniref:type II secretion system F family protein n=1 Tax=Escherichia coli TaxID=562 RepID=UPI002168ADDB|nr:type II secretion system F family protein [Escherichia coli]